MRKKIVVGNWKMNNNIQKTTALINEIEELLKLNKFSDVDIKIAPSFVNLYTAISICKNSQIEVISQNCHQKENGAYTGEVSVDMLKSIGVKTTILGHSERREYFLEDAQLLKEKVNVCLNNNFDIIFCIGEKLDDRKSNNYFNVIKEQLKESLFHLDEKYWENIILAYEPVWAIGTGETASPQQVQEIHSFIRNLLIERYNRNLANEITILYGGSCKSNNAKEIFSQIDVDGGLIGGASLNAKEFIEIANSF